MIEQALIVPEAFAISAAIGVIGGVALNYISRKIPAENGQVGPGAYATALATGMLVAEYLTGTPLLEGVSLAAGAGSGMYLGGMALEKYHAMNSNSADSTITAATA